MKMKKKHAIDIVFAVFWICFLSAGAFLLATSQAMGWPDYGYDSNLEMRNRIEFPQLSRKPIKKWGRSIAKWHSDNFPWRSDIIKFFRYLNLNVMKNPIHDCVPGRGRWVFRRNEHVWPEVEDYMGFLKIDDAMANDWRTLFEGRVAYAEAHGCHYLQVITPVKANVHPEKLPSSIARRKKSPSREDVRGAILNSPVSTNVLFLIDSLAAEAANGRVVFYDDDFHENPYGCYCIFRDITSKMRDLWYPDLVDFPFYATRVPDKVLSGSERGCWVYDDINLYDPQLVVSNPGAFVSAYEPLDIQASHPKFPFCPIHVEFPNAPDRSIVVCHDSFLRYPLSAWWHSDGMSDFAIPIGDCFRHVSMFLFRRLDTKWIDTYFAKAIPDVLMEQFSEGHLHRGPIGLDDTMRRAAEWGDGRPISAAEDARNGEIPVAMAVFESLSSTSTNEFVSTSLVDAAGQILSSVDIRPGVKRAAFFGRIPRSKCHIVMQGGVAASTNLFFKAVQ